MIEIFVVLGALCLGSFGNVFLVRFPKGRSLVHPASSCPHCGHAIRWRHNVPVLGWILLRGRCFDCRRPISPRYPAMEACFGAVAALVVWRFGVNSLALCYLAFFLGLLLIAWVDWETLYIFDACTVPMALLGMGMSWAYPEYFLSRFDSGVAALQMMAAMVLLGALGRAWYKKDVVGGGDLKLMAAGAAFLGCRNAWKALVLGVLLSLPLLLLYIRLKGLGRRDPAPFGPGLAAGLALTAWNVLGHGEFDGALQMLGLSMLKAN